MKKRILMLVSLLLGVAMLMATACTGGKNSETGAATGENDPAEPLPAWDKLSEYDPDGSDFRLSVDAKDEVHDISELLFGIFFEDINFAADGGLYAEMVKNRSFEFTEIAKDDQKHGWRNVGKVSAEVTVGDSVNGLNINNTNYMVIRNAENKRGGIANEGFLDGMAVTEDAEYIFSVYAKGIDGYTGPVYVDITVGRKSVASGVIEHITDKWEKYTLTLKSEKTSNIRCLLEVTIDTGAAAFDMVSLSRRTHTRGARTVCAVILLKSLRRCTRRLSGSPGDVLSRDSGLNGHTTGKTRSALTRGESRFCSTAYTATLPRASRS